jgi:hypothetical protein
MLANVPGNQTNNMLSAIQADGQCSSPEIFALGQTPALGIGVPSYPLTNYGPKGPTSIILAPDDPGNSSGDEPK